MIRMKYRAQSRVIYGAKLNPVCFFLHRWIMINSENYSEETMIDIEKFSDMNRLKII